VTLVTLPGVTDAATMRKIFFWRYMAVNRKTLLPALACALLVFSMLGCGATNHLQSITLSVTSQNGVSLTSQSGVYTLLCDGGTLQLAATGNYNNGKTKDLTNQVAFTMIVDPNYSVDAYNHPLPAPPATAQISTTGLITAVEPATCTWVDPVPAPGTASWFFMGAYQVTASLDGVTSQPAYIPVASQAGNQNYIFVTPNLMDNNPSEQCGPTPLQ
jgi:hypothetical protein